MCPTDHKETAAPQWGENEVKAGDLSPKPKQSVRREAVGAGQGRMSQQQRGQIGRRCKLDSTPNTKSLPSLMEEGGFGPQQGFLLQVDVTDSANQVPRNGPCLFLQSI